MSVLEQFKLDGKVALVTGASRGLGRAMALGLAEAGGDVVGMSRQGEDEELKEAVEKLGGRFLHVSCDLAAASVDELRQHVAQIVEEMGSLDILVNNAGSIRRSKVLEVSESDWDFVLQLNQKAAFFLAQAAGRVMKVQGSGKIINIASVLGYEGGLFALSYATTKHGMIGMTKSMSNELAQYNIQVNAIAPGYFRTEMTAALEADEARNAALLARVPAGRFGEPDELKGLVVYLASAASSFVSGSTFVIDGGWLGR